MYSGALFIEVALGWNLYYSVLLILGMTAFCTMAGGLAAVIYTDTLQFIIMIIGGIILMVFSFNEIGGYEKLYMKYMSSIPQMALNSTEKYGKCGIPNKNAFVILRGVNDPDMPWLGFLLGQTPASIWYWCSDQVIHREKS